MKHIKDYFNKHLKLKKITKCLGVVAIVLSFLFNALIGVALLVQYDHNDDTLIDSDPIRKNAPVLKEDYQLYNINSDIITKEFINSLLNYEDERSGFADYISIGEMVNAGTGASQDCRAGIGDSSSSTGIFGWFLYWNDYDPASFANYYVADNAIKVINVTNNRITYSGNYGNYYFREFEFALNFYNASQTLLISYRFSVGAYFNTSWTLLYTTLYNKQNNLNYILVNDYIVNTMHSNLVLTIYSNSNPDYKLGYEQGYNAGVASAHTENDGVFGLIAQAFSSVASIFNIVLIPGITIGTLIAVPLIVMVVIVLFKMFRG